MLSDLLAVLETPEFEEDGGVVLVSTRWTGAACELVLDVHTGNDRISRQAWRLRCDDVRDTRLTREWVRSPAFTAEHPLLLPFVEQHVTLYFHGRAPDGRTVVADLYEAHLAVAGRWHSFDAFLNDGGPLALVHRGVPMPLIELLASGGGMLADGPLGLLRSYAEVLEAHGIEPSFIGERPPRRWLDGDWRPEAPDLHVFLLGDSFVVGAGFTAERLPLESIS